MALKEADNLVKIDIQGDGEKLYSGNYACPKCGFSFEELTLSTFVWKV